MSRWRVLGNEGSDDSKPSEALVGGNSLDGVFRDIGFPGMVLKEALYGSDMESSHRLSCVVSLDRVFVSTVFIDIYPPPLFF